MSYEKAFEALKNGDFSTAVPLLERAAEETGYTSDVINHAYTIALYRRGDKSRLAEVSYRIATSLLEEDRASAMDYFQRALFAGLDPQRIREVAELFESWVVSPPTDPSLGKAGDRVAHIIGSVLTGHASAQYLKMLVTGLESQRIRSTVFTTESTASWFFNPAGVAQSQNVEMNAETRIASVEGDFVERAERIAQDIRASGIKIAFFHSGLAEQITSLVAVLRPVSVQIRVNHGDEMDADLFDGHVHLVRNAMERSRFSRPAEWIPPSSDIEERLRMSGPVSRQSMGLGSASTISATIGNLHEVAGAGYLRVLSEILNRFPTHFHVFAGSGNVRSIRSHLHSEGVLPRVRFLGDLSDIAPLLGVIDIYLAPFPDSEDHAIVEAMGSGKPVVVMRFLSNSPYNSGADLVGTRELIAPGEADYIETVDRLLRTPAFRTAQGNAMLDRFRAEFRPERLGERYKAFLEKFSTML